MLEVHVASIVCTDASELAGDRDRTLRSALSGFRVLTGRRLWRADPSPGPLQGFGQDLAYPEDRGAGGVGGVVLFCYRKIQLILPKTSVLCV